jgi:hypothetical protein
LSVIFGLSTMAASRPVTRRIVFACGRVRETRVDPYFVFLSCMATIGLTMSRMIPAVAVDA